MKFDKLPPLIDLWAWHIFWDCETQAEMNRACGLSNLWSAPGAAPLDGTVQSSRRAYSWLEKQINQRRLADWQIRACQLAFCPARTPTATRLFAISFGL